jgi:hypothetical protein
VSIVKDVVEKPKKYNHDIFGSLFSVLWHAVWLLTHITVFGYQL